MAPDGWSAAWILGNPAGGTNSILLTGDTLEVFNGICGAESGQVPVSARHQPLFSQLEVQKTRPRLDGRHPACSGTDGITRRAPGRCASARTRHEHAITFAGRPIRPIAFINRARLAPLFLAACAATVLGQREAVATPPSPRLASAGG